MAPQFGSETRNISQTVNSMIYVSTTKVQLDKALQNTCGGDCVDWAIGMLVQGRDTPNLTRLAAQLPPFNHFELCSLRDQVLEELCISNQSLSELALNYSCECIRSALNDDIELIEAVATVADIYISCDYFKPLSRFYLLHFAREDLLISDTQWYWDGADQTNILSIIKEQAESFLAENSN